METLIRLSVEGGIGTIHLDNPPVNLISAQLRSQLTAVAREAGERSDIAVVIVYGGADVFATGADIGELAMMSYQDMVLEVDALQGCFNAVAAIPKPVIAAVSGFAVGGGCELAIAADLRVAGETVLFALPEVHLGVMPGGGATQRLPRLIGPARAKRMIFTGCYVDAQEALEIGLVDWVVPDGDVYEEALARAEALVKGPRQALRAAKAAIDAGAAAVPDAGLAMERVLFASLFATEDRAIGMESFLAEGPGRAEFTGL